MRHLKQALLLCGAAIIASNAIAGPALPTREVAGKSERIARCDDREVRIASLRFARADYVAALRAAVALRKMRLDLLPDFPSCSHAAAMARLINRSRTARAVLRREGLSPDRFAETMWSMAWAFADTDLTVAHTDAMQLNRKTLDDPEIDALLAALDRD